MNSHNQGGWNGCLDVDRDVWGCVNNVTLRYICWHVMFTGIWPLRCWMTPLTWSTLSLLKGQTSMPWVWCSGRLLAGVQLEVGHCGDIYFLSFSCMIIIALLWVTFTYIFLYVYCKNTTCLVNYGGAWSLRPLFKMIFFNVFILKRHIGNYIIWLHCWPFPYTY